MLTITSIIGNIFDDKKLMTKFKQMESRKRCQRLKISRLELERSRIRKKTDLGTDIGLILDSGTRLHHGDVIVSNLKKFIIIEQLPEKVISIRIRQLKKNPNGLVILGHIIGNRHKPIVINDDILYFPVQAYSEVEIFKKLLVGVMNNLEIEVGEQIFQPQHGMYMHEH
ncbi:MAG: urease accessory protein UreE [Thaumarchaeota archaeon]|nr:urease accessory protein UreE [Nitrososphaerota archaeon]MBI3642039.1 urease accessory protein UreE [Nitrososphaerota archaeon]